MGKKYRSADSRSLAVSIRTIWWVYNAIVALDDPTTTSQHLHFIFLLLLLLWWWFHLFCVTSMPLVRCFAMQKSPQGKWFTVFVISLHKADETFENLFLGYTDYVSCCTLSKLFTMLRLLGQVHNFTSIWKNLFQGIYITEVAPNSPAALSGLKQHDKILQCNGYDFTLVSAWLSRKTVWDSTTQNVH